MFKGRFDVHREKSTSRRSTRAGAFTSEIAGARPAMRPSIPAEYALYR